MYNTNLTKKVKKPINKETEINLWKEFDREYNCNKDDFTLECLYRKRASREYCEKCESGLVFQKKGFWFV